MLKVVRCEADEVTSCGSTCFDALAQEVPARGFCLRMKGRGQSMYPLIQNGDILLIEPKSTDEFKIGDIIFYRRPSGTYVVHRLIKKNGSATLQSKGDNLPYYDAPVTVGEVLGKVIQIEGGGRRIRLQGGPRRTLAWVGRGRGSTQTRLRQNLVGFGGS